MYVYERRLGACKCWFDENNGGLVGSIKIMKGFDEYKGF